MQSLNYKTAACFLHKKTVKFHQSNHNVWIVSRGNTVFTYDSHLFIFLAYFKPVKILMRKLFHEKEKYKKSDNIKLLREIVGCNWSDKTLITLTFKCNIPQNVGFLNTLKRSRITINFKGRSSISILTVTM